MVRFATPARLPGLYALPWVDSTESELVTAMFIQKVESGSRLICLGGEPDTGRRHLTAHVARYTKKPMLVVSRGEQAEPGEKSCIVQLESDQNRADFWLPLPSIERRLGIVLCLLEHRKIVFDRSVSEILAEAFSTHLTPLVAATLRAADFAYLNNCRLDALTLEEVLCDYDPGLS